MKIRNTCAALVCSFLLYCSCAAFGQSETKALETKVDEVITSAYKIASSQFPCKLGIGGRQRRLDWKKIETCLNAAYEKVDWEDVSGQFQKLREHYRVQSSEINSMAERSLSAHAIPFNQLFAVKSKNAQLPLSSSLLKFLPENSLQDLPIFDAFGKQIGVFTGVYYFEKIGEITGRVNRIALFQFTDPYDKITAAPERLLLDSFGVLWKDAENQAGFRMPPDKIIIK
jgi:hypothetical protein